MPNIGPPFPTSCVGQFHRLFRNWNLHSSIAILAPFCRADIVPGCFVTSFLCFLVNGKRLGLLYSCVLDLRSFDGFPMLASVLKATQKINLLWNYFMALENLFIIKITHSSENIFNSLITDSICFVKNNFVDKCSQVMYFFLFHNLLIYGI